MKAWGRWLDNKGDFLVPRSRDTREAGARPGKLSFLGPRGRSALLPTPTPRYQREDGEVGGGQVEPIPL